MIRRLLGKRWRVIVTGVLITTAPLIGLALFVNFSLTGDLERIELGRRKQFAASAAHIILVRLDGDIAYGEAFARRPLLRQALRVGDVAEMESHLKDLVTASGTFERALVCSPEGIRLANYPPDPSVIGRSVADRDWYKGVLRTKTSYVSGFYLRDAHPRRYLFSMAAPIVSADGKIIGILHLSPKENYLRETLRGLGNHDNGLVYVVDGKGHLVYHPDRAIDRLVDVSSSPAVAHVKTGREGADRFRDPGTGRTMVAAYHPLAPWGWGVVTELPLKEALAPVNRVVNGFYLFLGVLLLVGGHLAYRWAELLNKAHSLASQLSERTVELEEANGHLNRQKAELGRQRERLEEKVAQRTAVLSMEIEARRQAEEALNAANAYNRSLIEASIDPLVTIGAGGEITDVNSATEKVTGRVREELIGTDFSEYFTEPELARSGYEKVFREGTVRDYALEIRHRDGHVTPVLYNAAVYRDETGEVAGVFAAARDITERRDLERQLRQAQKLEAIGTLAGGIAHDFNNILTAIIGFGSLLEMKMSRDDPQRVNVTQILTAADRAANLTRSLLAFSRKQVIEVRPVCLNDIVAGLEPMLRRVVREDIELHIDLRDAPLTVLADAGQLDQVLLNLTTNALDAMPAGGSITISTARATLDERFRSAHGFGESGEYALLSFADSGEGMAEDVRQRIFEPFYTTKEVGKGTGLGLAVCYGIIEQHSGYISCRSALGQGTAFCIHLPLVRGESRRPETAPEARPAGGTETILVTEDEPMVRELTTGILREFGYTVIEAADGEEAVAQFAAHQGTVDLCLLDVIMPKKKGWEAYEEIKGLRPDAKVLFMSGYQADVTFPTGLAQEGAELIPKPVVPHDLLRKVREVLDR
jgi:PAS domain S-box-containing protein